MGVKPPYARRGIDYFTKNKVFPIDGSVTLEGLKVNIDVQFRDGVLKEPLPSPEKYVDQSFVAPSAEGIRIINSSKRSNRSSRSNRRTADVSKSHSFDHRLQDFEVALDFVGLRDLRPGFFDELRAAHFVDIGAAQR